MTCVNSSNGCLKIRDVHNKIGHAANDVMHNHNGIHGLKDVLDERVLLR